MSNGKGKSTFRKYATVLLLSAGAAAIYTVPYIRETFYVPMQTAMGLNNTQMALLTSLYAILSVPSYFVGGIAADKFSPRTMLTFSFISTGLLGLWLSTFPGYAICRLIFAIMGVTTVLTFWPSAVKAIRMLGSDDEQGKLYGMYEGLRGFLNAGIVLAMAFVYARFANNVDGASHAIVFASVCDLAIGVLCFLFIERGNVRENNETIGQVAVGMFRTLKIPKIWLLTAIVFTAYSVYGMMSYVPAYAQAFCGLSIDVSNNLGAVRYLMQGIGGICGGILADRIGSRLKVISGAGVLLAISYALFFIIPESSSALVVLLINYMFGVMLVYVLRSMYFADISECGLPVETAGRVSGLMSTLGYLPDVIILPLVGSWLDNAAGSEGYFMTFGLCIVMAVLCTVLAFALYRVNKTGQKRTTAVSEK